MEKILAPRLKEGDEIRVIAPSSSMSLPFILAARQASEKTASDLGLKVTYGKHVNEMNSFDSSSIEHRLEDLHEAFSDRNVKLVIAVIGGFNSNQLLRGIDFGLIRRNPKMFCGYSDITALNNAIFAKTGLVNYSGPCFYTFGYGEGDIRRYSISNLRKCLYGSDPYTPDKAYDIQEWATKAGQNIQWKSDGYWVLHPGKASGTIVGANLCTMNLLQGTEFMPGLKGSLLFVEDDDASDRKTFDRNLQSLLQQPGADKITGVVIGRFQKESEIDRKTIEEIVATKKELEGVPVIANADFGHTYPMITFPIGGTGEFDAEGKEAALRIVRH